MYLADGMVFKRGSPSADDSEHTSISSFDFQKGQLYCSGGGFQKFDQCLDQAWTSVSLTSVSMICAFTTYHYKF